MKKDQIHEGNIYKVSIEGEVRIDLIRITDGFEFVTKYGWDDSGQKAYLSSDSYEVVVLDNEEQSVITATDYNEIRNTLIGAAGWGDERDAVCKAISVRYDLTGGPYQSNYPYRAAFNLSRIHVQHIKERLVVADHYAEKAAKAYERIAR